MRESVSYDVDLEQQLLLVWIVEWSTSKLSCWRDVDTHST